VNHVRVLILDSSAMTFSSNGFRLIVLVAAAISLTRRKGCGDDGDKATSDSDDDDREDDSDTSLGFMVDTTSLIRCGCTICVPGENAADGTEERRRETRAKGRK